MEHLLCANHCTKNLHASAPQKLMTVVRYMFAYYPHSIEKEMGGA